MATREQSLLPLDLLSDLRAQLRKARRDADMCRNAATTYAEEAGRLRAEAETLRSAVADACGRLGRMAELVRELGLVPCMCGAVYRPAGQWIGGPFFEDLGRVGEQIIPSYGGEPGYVLEIRNCPCGSSISREVR